MPIYSYRCDHCGHQQDVLQKMSDPLLVTCPACGQATYRKQVTAAGFQLKGSGWYVTDFRNPATKEAKGVTKPEAGGAEKGATPESSGTTEAAKPAASETKSEASPAPKSADGGSGSSGGTT